MLIAFAAAVSAGLVPDKIEGLSRAADLAQSTLDGGEVKVPGSC